MAKQRIHEFHNAAESAVDGNILYCKAHYCVVVQISGISGDTITFKGTVDGTNWVAIRAMNLNDGTLATTATGDGLYRINLSGLVGLMADITTYSSGTITVTGFADQGFAYDPGVAA